MRNLLCPVLFLTLATTTATAQCLTAETARRGYVLFTDQGAETHRFSGDVQITERLSGSAGLQAPTVIKARHDMSHGLPLLRSQETLSLGDDRWPDDRYALRQERQIIEVVPFARMAQGESMTVVLQENRRENMSEGGSWRTQSRFEPITLTYTLKGQDMISVGTCRYQVWLIDMVSQSRMSGMRSTSRLAYSPDVLFFLNSAAGDGRDHPVQRIEPLPY